MRSGSSELLLEQQQQELRNRKLRELAPKKKNGTKPAQTKTWRERIKFYATSTLAFFSVTTGASLLFLVPLYVDPAISTLVSDFIDMPTMCMTTRREDVVGIMNCSWSSCREGCTSDMYKCTHIYVTYIEMNFTNTNNFLSTNNGTITSTTTTSTSSLSTKIAAAAAGTTTTTTTSTTTQSLALAAQSLILMNMSDFEHSADEAILLVNIKGCGYPPSVTCKNFTEIYGYDGAIFPCYYSRLNKTLVLTTYNRDEQIAVIINYFVIPFIITVLSSTALCILHCDCSCKKERNSRGRGPGPHRRRPQRMENLSDSSISTRVDMLTPAIEVYKPPL